MNCKKNLEVFKSVQKKSGCKILLALKGFAMHRLFPEISEVLKGVSASSLYEAQLGKEFFPGEIHVYAPAFREDEFVKIRELADHIVFNSLSQWDRFKSQMKGEIRAGLRVNPEHSEVKVGLYDPCAKNSRLGIPLIQLKGFDWTGISGIHFHTLCESSADALERTLFSVEKKFGEFFKKLKWINFGGGHHISRPGYDVDLLAQLIKNFKEKYSLEVYLEPGEAVALNIGVLVSTVLDIVFNKMKIAILDISATAHMPDVLEMPYRPEIIGAGNPGEFSNTYRLGGLTCLAGDIVGDYSFPNRLKIGEKIVFTDMAHYTMVKNTTFNGVNLPAIGVFDSKTRSFELVKNFGYNDFKNRLS